MDLISMTTLHRHTLENPFFGGTGYMEAINFFVIDCICEKKKKAYIFFNVVIGYSIYGTTA